MNLTSVLIELMANAGALEQLAADGAATWHAVAQGQGGVAKAEAALASLTMLVGHAAQALAAVKAPPAA